MARATVMIDLEPRLHEQVPDYVEQMRAGSLANILRDHPRGVLAFTALHIVALILVVILTNCDRNAIDRSSRPTVVSRP